MHDYRITTDPQEIQSIFEVFDTDNSGYISYSEFLRQIVGEMNNFRREYCKKAFRLLDHHNDGIVDLADIKRKYNAKKHPDVLAGKRSEDDVLCEFLDTFEAHYTMMHGN